MVNPSDSESCGVNINEIFGLLHHCDSIFGRDAFASERATNDAVHLEKPLPSPPTIDCATPKFSAVSDFVGLVNRFYED